MSVSAVDIYARFVERSDRPYGWFYQDSDYGHSVEIDPGMDDRDVREFHEMWCECSAVVLWDRKDGTWSIHAQMPFPHHHYHGNDFSFSWEDAITIASMISDHYEKEIVFLNREAQ